jgi:glycosyltransferase involved in cell wall biosynthesis
MHNNYPKISVITTSLNYGEFIEECILSVKKQTYLNIEHIIMDGGSTDRTIDIIKKYTGTYNLKWKSEKDRGQSNAFNKAIQLAKGDWLLFINSDDFLLETTTIEDAVRFISQKPNYLIYMGHNISVDWNGKPLYKPPFYEFKIFTHDSFMNKNAPVVHQATLYNKKVFRVVGNYREKFYYHMDYEFTLRATKYFEVCPLNIYVAALRKHNLAKTQRGAARGNLELLVARLMNGGSFFNVVNFTILKGFFYQLILPRRAKNKIKRLLRNLAK